MPWFNDVARHANTAWIVHHSRTGTYSLFPPCATPDMLCEKIQPVQPFGPTTTWLEAFEDYAGNYPAIGRTRCLQLGSATVITKLNGRAAFPFIRRAPLTTPIHGRSAIATATVWIDTKPVRYNASSTASAQPAPSYAAPQRRRTSPSNQKGVSVCNARARRYARFRYFPTFRHFDRRQYMRKTGGGMDAMTTAAGHCRSFTVTGGVAPADCARSALGQPSPPSVPLTGVSWDVTDGDIAQYCF